jgi:hypothetical protein
MLMQTCQAADAMCVAGSRLGALATAPEVVKCGFGGFSQACFELGNRLLDEVEAGRIARQKAQLGGSVFQDPADGAR